MRKFGLLGTSALRSAAAIGLVVAFANPAFAQGTAQPEQNEPTPTPGQVAQPAQNDQTDTPADAPETLQSEAEIESGQDAEASGSGEQQLTVTGSRIRRPNLESSIPITSVGGEEFFQQGSTNIGETLNELPQLRSTFAQSNPGLGLGVAGLNLLDLRGLGTQRTLVLVNGRRHVPADIQNNAVSPDVNTIPNDLVERVDVVTGGNSAIYGSDAIAGVVNFILRRDFEGLQIRGNAGISEEGYGGNQYVSAMYGMNFADGRGNVTVHGEYANQDRVFTSDVPFLRTQNGLFLVDVDAAGSPQGSDGIPDRVFIRDVRSRSINRFGLIPITQQAGTTPGACGNAVTATGALGAPFNCVLVFNPESGLDVGTGGSFGSSIIGSAVGGNLQTGRERGLFSVLPGYERYNANLLAHFTFTEALEAFVEAKYSRVNVQGSNFGPFGIQGVLGQFDVRQRPRLDNPFLTPAQRQQIANAILASNCNPSLTVACPATTNIGTAAAPVIIPGNLTPAQRAQIAAGTFRFPIARNILDIGARDEKFNRDTYRIVGGLRGTFNEDWSYEVSANYGRTEESLAAQGFVDVQRFQLSLDAGVNPTTGAIECRSKFDPAAATGSPFGDPDRLASDIAACVPYDPFGENAAQNRAAGEYFLASPRVDGKIEQLVFSGFVSGDTSQLFELPGGPVRFALGAEYRRQETFYDQDEFSASGATNFLQLGLFNPPAFEVKEAFAEVQVPILRDTPFFHDLTVSGAGRVADYKGATGTVFAYNAGIEYAPIRDIRFRANYGRAIRAPNQTETFGELIPNFAPGFTDPCSSSRIGSGTQFRAANCQADLGPLLANIPNTARSLQVLSGVNPNLQEETSDSITIGAVIQPRFIPGFSLSIDYYDIEVKGVIASASAQQIIDGCYDQPSLDNPFCDLFERFLGPGMGPFDELPGEVEGNTTIQAPLNFARRIRRGIDFEAAYRTTLMEDLRFDGRIIYSHQLKNSNFQNPNLPNFENRLLGELGDPQDEFRLDVDLTSGPFTFGYELRYIGPQFVNFFEDFNPLQDRPPQDADYADIQQYRSVMYHDIRFDWKVKEGGENAQDLNFFVGVDNIFDQNPPLGLTGTGAGSAIYNIRGRNYYAGFRARF
jgi:outer membrane receptor protein involved in Fe transport